MKGQKEKDEANGGEGNERKGRRERERESKGSEAVTEEKGRAKCNQKENYLNRLICKKSLDILSPFSNFLPSFSPGSLTLPGFCVPANSDPLSSRVVYPI